MRKNDSTVELIKKFLKWRDKENAQRRDDCDKMNREAEKKHMISGYSYVEVESNLEEFIRWLESPPKEK